MLLEFWQMKQESFSIWSWKWCTNIRTCFLVGIVSPILQIRNDVICHIFEVGIFIFVTGMSCSVHASLQITTHDYPLMNYTSPFSEENFKPGRTLVIMLSVAGEVSSSNKVRYLIQDVYLTSRCPVLVLNFSNEMTQSMYTEIHQHYSYIILISGPCKDWEQNTFGIRKQLSALSGDKMSESWKPNARFIIQVMANCTQFESKNMSRSILSHLWTYQVSNAVVLFLKPDAYRDNDMQQKTSNSAQSTYWELHTWYPYENSERCNPADGKVPVKVFTVRNLSDITKNTIFKRYYEKTFSQMFNCS